MKKTFDYEVYMTIDDDDFTVKGEATYYPGSPGCYYGPPENCYEAEPDELEIDSETWYDEDNKEAVLSRTLTKCEEEELYDKVYDDCRSLYEAICDQRY